MSSPSRQRPSPVKGQHLNSSNSTSALFAGSVQKSWMSKASTSDGQTPKTSIPRVSASSPTSKSIAHLPGNAPLQIQPILIECHNINHESVSPPQLPPDSNDTQGAAKRRRTSHGNDTSSKPVAQGPDRSKRPRLDDSQMTGDVVAEEATATLPSPPNDRTPRESEFRAPSCGVNFVPISRNDNRAAAECLQSGNPKSPSKSDKPPLAINSSEAATFISDPTQTRSPPLEVTSPITSSSIARTTQIEKLPRSLMGNMPLRNSSAIEPTPVTNTGQPLNQGQTQHPLGNHESTKSSQFFRRSYEEATMRLDLILEQPNPSSIELARLRLLKQASSSNDEFFLILHQIYCNQNKSPEQRWKSSRIRDGFLVLQRLLAPNDQLTNEAITWFTEFARMPSNADQERLEGRVCHFLGALAMLWSRLLSAYPPFKLPPSTFALLVHLPGLTSIVLQQVIFRASLRTSWVGPHDECVEQCESVFADDQQLVQNFMKDRRPDDPSINPSLSRYDKIATKKFMKILVGHQAHSNGLHNSANDNEQSQRPTLSSFNGQDLGRVPQHQQENVTGTPTNLRTRPPLPHLNIQAIKDSYPGKSPGGFASPSPVLAKPFSVLSVNGSRSSHPLPTSSPSTPACMSDRNMSVPSSVTQSPQSDTSHLPAVTATSIRRQQYAQPPLTTQVLDLSNVRAISNDTQGGTIHAISGASSTGPERRSFGAQPLSQPHQMSSIPQPSHPQPWFPTRQSGERPQFAQPHYLSQMEHAARMRQNLVTQQNPYVQEHSAAGVGPSSTLPSSQRRSLATHSAEGPFQHTLFSRHTSGSEFPASRQPCIPQTIPTYPPHNYGNFRHLMYNPAVQTPAAPHTTTATGPVSHTQTFVSQPQMIIPNRFVRNMAPSLLQVSNPDGPQLGFLDPSNPRGEVKSFRYIKYIYSLHVMTASSKSLEWKEHIDNSVIQQLPGDIAGPKGLPFRQVSVGSYLARVRCIKQSHSHTTPTSSQWAMTDTTWPPSISISINGNFFEVRPKSTGGKDLPVDVTRMLKSGQNEFQATVSGIAVRSTDRWLVCLELVEVVDAARIKQMLNFQSHSDCSNRMLEKLRSKDLEVEVVKPQTVLDLTDPFTSRIFDTPVRGKDCAHNQCFDLDTFLQTRSTVSPSVPCLSEEFRCPICKGDVRPHVMVVDGYLAFIRSELEKRGRLDVKAVILHESGEWEIKEEESIKTDSDESSNGPRKGPDRQSTGNLVSKKKAIIDVIVLDDD